VTGFVVPRRDPAALAAALARLAADPVLRQRLGAAGRQRAQDCFRPEAQIAAFDRFFRDVARVGYPRAEEGRVASPPYKGADHAR